MGRRKKIFSATKKDFRIDWFSGTGAGGQHRNKHQNCCRITHIESGITATCQDHKDRPTNQKIAFSRLVKKLTDHYKWSNVERPKQNPKTIRTYHGVRNIVKDHRTGRTESYKKVVDGGDLSDFIGED